MLPGFVGFPVGHMWSDLRFCVLKEKPDNGVVVGFYSLCLLPDRDLFTHIELGGRNLARFLTGGVPTTELQKPDSSSANAISFTQNFHGIASACTESYWYARGK